MKFFARAGTILLSVVASLSVCEAGVNEWTTKGPSGGAFLEVKASSTAASTFYAIYARSIHKSIDGGITWSTLRSFNEQLTDIAVDPSDGNRVYVATAYEGVYGTEDGGRSFAPLEGPGFSDMIWSVGANSTTVYYGTAGNVLRRSTDRGRTWTNRGPTPSIVLGMMVDAQNADIIYARNHAQLYKTLDGGTSWTQSAIGSSSNQILDLAQLSSTQLVAATQDGLYVSSNAGVTWVLALSGAYRAVVADARIPGRVVAISKAANRQLHQSIDSGATWSPLGKEAPGAIDGVAMDSQSSTRMVGLGLQHAMRTADGAQTWAEAAQSPVATTSAATSTTIASNSKVYVFTTTSTIGGIGLFATSGDSGWQSLNLDGVQALVGNSLGRGVLAVGPGQPNSLYFYAVGQSLVHSADAGNTWTRLSTDMSGFNVSSLAFDVDDSRIMYATVSNFVSTPSEGIYRSIDGGATWSPRSTNLGADFSSATLRIDPADGSRMFFGAEGRFNAPGTGGLWRSTDRGITWTRLSFASPPLLEDVSSIAINPANPSRIYLVTPTGLYTSSNGGDSFTWSQSFANTTGNRAPASMVVDPVVPTTLYAASLPSSTLDSFPRIPPPYSHVLRSVDDGQTWEVLRAPTDVPGWAVNFVTLDPQKPSLLYASAADRGIATLEIAPDLSVEIDGHSGTRPLGSESTLTFRVSNNGPFAATAVRLAATLPAGLANVTATADNGTCTAGMQTSCIRSVLRTGEHMNVVVKYTPTAEMSLAVTASVTAQESDSSPANNAAQATASATAPGTAPNPTAPISPSGGAHSGGGGGGLDLAVLMALLSLYACRAARHSSRPIQAGSQTV